MVNTTENTRFSLRIYNCWPFRPDCLRMKARLEGLAKFDEVLIDLHGTGTLDGFTFEFLTFMQTFGILLPVVAYYTQPRG